MQPLPPTRNPPRFLKTEKNILLPQPLAQRFPLPSQLTISLSLCSLLNQRACCIVRHFDCSRAVVCTATARNFSLSSPLSRADFSLRSALLDSRPLLRKNEIEIRRTYIYLYAGLRVFRVSTTLLLLHLFELSFFYGHARALSSFCLYISA